MRILPDFSPVRHNRAFGRLLVGGLLSTLGSVMTSFAVVLQIWDLSRSSLAVGLLIGTGGAPLGNIESGTVAALTSPVVSAVSGGVGCAAVTVLIGFAFPAFTRYRARPTVVPAGAPANSRR
jgi:hypothetical protein